MRTLDKSKPYSTVHGDGVRHRYEQDHLLFNAAGEQVDADGEPMKPAKGEPKTAAAPAPSPASAEVDAQVAAQTGGSQPEPEPAPAAQSGGAQAKAKKKK